MRMRKRSAAFLVPESEWARSKSNSIKHLCSRSRTADKSSFTNGQSKEWEEPGSILSKEPSLCPTQWKSTLRLMSLASSGFKCINGKQCALFRIKTFWANAKSHFAPGGGTKQATSKDLLMKSTACDFDKIRPTAVRQRSTIAWFGSVNSSGHIIVNSISNIVLSRSSSRSKLRWCSHIRVKRPFRAATFLSNGSSEPKTVVKIGLRSKGADRAASRYELKKPKISTMLVISSESGQSLSVWKHLSMLHDKTSSVTSFECSASRQIFGKVLRSTGIGCKRTSTIRIWTGEGFSERALQSSVIASNRMNDKSLKELINCARNCATRRCRLEKFFRIVWIKSSKSGWTFFRNPSNGKLNSAAAQPSNSEEILQAWVRTLIICPLILSLVAFREQRRKTKYSLNFFVSLMIQSVRLLSRRRLSFLAWMSCAAVVLRLCSIFFRSLLMTTLASAWDELFRGQNIRSPHYTAAEADAPNSHNLAATRPSQKEYYFRFFFRLFWWLSGFALAPLGFSSSQEGSSCCGKIILVVNFSTFSTSSIRAATNWDTWVGCGQGAWCSLPLNHQ